MLDTDRAAQESFPLQIISWTVVLIDVTFMTADGDYNPTVASGMISLFAEYATTIRTIPPSRLHEAEMPASSSMSRHFIMIIPSFRLA